MGAAKFGIFDTFADANGAQCPPFGEIAKALFAKAEDLFAKPPMIEQPEILAAKRSEPREGGFATRVSGRNTLATRQTRRTSIPDTWVDEFYFNRGNQIFERTLFFDYQDMLFFVYHWSVRSTDEVDDVADRLARASRPKGYYFNSPHYRRSAVTL